MVDLNRAYQEVKSLPDEALHKELSSPTGMLPGYLVMAELDERRGLRGGGGNPNQASMKEEMLQGVMPEREFSKGGIIAGLNQFNSFMQGLKNPQISGGLMQDQINQLAGGLPSLMPAQAPGMAGPPPYLSDLVPTPPQAPQQLGGLASLRMR